MAYKPSSEEDQPYQSNKCPTPEAVIDQYLKQQNPRIPKGAPPDPFQFARWWMAHQEEGDRFTEAASPPATKGGEWKTPYHDRLVYTLKKFVRLSAVQQVFVIEYVEKGLPWRGDDIEDYRRYVEEWQIMQDEIAAGHREKFIDDAFKKMHKAVRSMTT